MRRNTIILALVIALFGVTIAAVQSDGGLDKLTVAGNGDPGACLLTLSLTLYGDRIKFSEKVTNNNVPDCTYHNLTFWPIFKNDWSTSGQVTLSNTSDSTVFEGNLSLATVKSLYDGTACIAYSSGYNFCQFKYGQVIFTVGFWVQGGVISTNWKDLFYPIYGLSVPTTIASTTVYVPSTNMLGVAGFLYTQCGGWSNNIINLNTPITITGKVYASNVIDLKTNLSNFMAKTAYIRKTGAAIGDYLTVSTWGYYPFNGVGSGGCYVTNMTYAQILPNMSYCANGCEISWDMLDVTTARFYLLQTNGITTKTNLRE